MDANSSKIKGRIGSVRKNLRHGVSLAWAASPSLLIRYTLLWRFNSIMPPVAVYLGAMLVNKIAEARLHTMEYW